MDVDQFGPSGPPVDMYGQQPAGPNQVQPPQFSPPPPASRKGKKLPLIIAGLVVAILAVVVIAGVVMNGGNKTPSNQPQESEETSEIDGPQPASAVSTEQANNSISQDISGLNDDQDFPVDQLSDDELGL